MYFRRSLAIEENQLGEDHPHVAATLADLAAISLASGSTEEAEDLLRRALAITEKTTSAETGTLHCLAECTRKRGRHSEAEGLLMRALAIEQRSNSGDALASSGGSAFASTTPSSGAGPVAATLGELASCACEAGRAEQAEEWFRRALEAEEEKLGKGHRDVAATLTRLGKCLSQQNKVEEAAEAHRRALSIVEETEGDRCLEVIGGESRAWWRCRGLFLIFACLGGGACATVGVRALVFKSPRVRSSFFFGWDHESWNTNGDDRLFTCLVLSRRQADVPLVCSVGFWNLLRRAIGVDAYHNLLSRIQSGPATPPRDVPSPA